MIIFLLKHPSPFSAYYGKTASTLNIRTSISKCLTMNDLLVVQLVGLLVVFVVGMSIGNGGGLLLNGPF